jgi:hypothetical protein
MGSDTIRINNQSMKSKAYIIYTEDLYILESTKDVLLVPKLDLGSSYDFTIDAKYYVRAKLSSSSVAVSRW